MSIQYARTISVTCPHCATVNKIHAAETEYYKIVDGRPFLYICDVEQGGCDCTFVVVINLDHVTDTYKIPNLNPKLNDEETK